MWPHRTGLLSLEVHRSFRSGCWVKCGNVVRAWQKCQTCLSNGDHRKRCKRPDAVDTRHQTLMQALSCLAKLCLEKLDRVRRKVHLSSSLSRQAPRSHASKLPEARMNVYPRAEYCRLVLLEHAWMEVRMIAVHIVKPLLRSLFPNTTSELAASVLAHVQQTRHGAVTSSMQRGTQPE